MTPNTTPAPMTHEEAVVVVCQGPPRCDLIGSEAMTAQRAGCVWCKRIHIDATGETTQEPGHA